MKNMLKCLLMFIYLIICVQVSHAAEMPDVSPEQQQQQPPHKSQHKERKQHKPKQPKKDTAGRFEYGCREFAICNNAGLDFTLSHPHDTRTYQACNPQVLEEIHRFSNLNLNIQKSTGPPDIFIQSLLVLLKIQPVGTSRPAENQSQLWSSKLLLTYKNVMLLHNDIVYVRQS